MHNWGLVKFHDEFEDGERYFFQGKFYEGQMKYFKPHGAGRIIINLSPAILGGGFGDQVLYEGQFSNGVPTGFGRLINSKGEIYEGPVNAKLLKNGFGKLRRSPDPSNANVAEYCYKGWFVNNLRDNVNSDDPGSKVEQSGALSPGGQTSLTYPNEEKWSDGSVYKGGYKSGKKHGRGHYLHPVIVEEGKPPVLTEYKGTYLNGKMHGRGKFKYANGNVYDGDWHDGVQQGKGTFTWAEDGSSYEGEFWNNLRHGSGTYFDGRSKKIHYEGMWKDGKPYTPVQEG